jgi:hypothetical protein
MDKTDAKLFTQTPWKSGRHEPQYCPHDRLPQWTSAMFQGDVYLRASP